MNDHRAEELLPRVVEWIVEICPASPPGLNADSEVLESGILDSLSLLRLVATFEEAYDTSIDPASLVPEHFRTVATISRFLADQLPGAGD